MSFPNNPVPLGKVTVAAAGTPVSLVSNFSSDPQYLKLAANKLEIQALITNTGYIYVGYAGMDKSTGANVLRVLSAGESYGITDPAAANVFDVYKYHIDADNNGEGVYTSAHVR